MSSGTPSPGNADRRVIRTSLHGLGLLMNPRLNKGTAFTEAERDAPTASRRTSVRLADSMLQCSYVATLEVCCARHHAF